MGKRKDDNIQLTPQEIDEILNFLSQIDQEIDKSLDYAYQHMSRSYWYELKRKNIKVRNIVQTLLILEPRSVMRLLQTIRRWRRTNTKLLQVIATEDLYPAQYNALHTHFNLPLTGNASRNKNLLARYTNLK